VSPLGPESGVPVGPLQEAFRAALDTGESENTIALRMGWTRGNGHGDIQRLKRTLGLVPMSHGSINKHMAYHNAVLLVRALNRDPVDLGV
jgi:hypothetical protein